MHERESDLEERQRMDAERAAAAKDHQEHESRHPLWIEPKEEVSEDTPGE